MIVSGVDRYVATWFDALKKVQGRVGALVYTGENCIGGIYGIYYYIHSVSVSDGTVVATFVTRSPVTSQDVGSMEMYGMYGSTSMCINANQIDGLKAVEDAPLSEYQFTAVFHT